MQLTGFACYGSCCPFCARSAALSEMNDFDYAATVAFVSLGNKEPNSDAVPKSYEEAITLFPDPLAPGFMATATIGESDEAANYGTRYWVGFCVSSVCRRTYGPCTRDGLLAWRGFRCEYRLERRTTPTRDIVLSIRRKFPMGARFSFMMPSVWL